jgi:hypothetical protein
MSDELGSGEITNRATQQPGYSTKSRNADCDGRPRRQNEGASSPWLCEPIPLHAGNAQDKPQLADFISAEGGFSLETMQENPAHPRIIMTPLARNFLDTIEAFRYASYLG